MSEELFYTSVPRGLKPGTRGFCAVAMTRSLPATLAERLESLSGYRPLYPAGHALAGQNPVAHAHWRLVHAGRTLSVLSRVCFAGLDYTQRANKFAHHVVLGPDELPAGGPAWAMLRAGVMESTWAGDPAFLERGRTVPSGSSPPRVCSHWQAATGDAGWAGVLAGSFLVDSDRPAYIIYAPGTDMLRLLDEAMALVPEASRWRVTFSTYFTDLPAGLTCHWRCCVAGTPAAREAERVSAAGGLLIDLTQPRPVAENTELVLCARSGAVAPSMDAARDAVTLPAGLTRRSPRTSIAQTYELSVPNAPEADAADQSWMPPVSATVVETERLPAHGGPAALWWFAMAAGWILATIFLVTLLTRAPAASTTPPTTQPGAPTAGEPVPWHHYREKRDQVAELEARLREHEQWIRPELLLQVQAERDDLAKQIAVVQRELDETKNRLTASDAPKLAPQTQAALRAPGEQTDTTRPTSMPASRGPVAVFQKLPAPTDGKRGVEWPCTGIDVPGRLALHLAHTTPKYRCESSGAADVVTLWRPAKGGLGKDAVIAEFRLEPSRAIGFRWVATTAEAADRNMINYSILEVVSKNGEAKAFYRFLGNKEQLWHVESEAKIPEDLPEPLAKQISLKAISMSEHWQVPRRDGNGLSIRVHSATDHDAAFDIVCDSKNLTTTWKQALAAAQKERASAVSDKQAAQADVAECQRKLEEATKDGQQSNVDAKTAHARAKEKYTAASQRAEKADVVLKAYDKEVKVDVQLMLPNGMCPLVLKLKNP